MYCFGLFWFISRQHLKIQAITRFPTSSISYILLWAFLAVVLRLLCTWRWARFSLRLATKRLELHIWLSLECGPALVAYFIFVTNKKTKFYNLINNSRTKLDRNACFIFDRLFYCQKLWLDLNKSKYNFIWNWKWFHYTCGGGREKQMLIHAEY